MRAEDKYLQTARVSSAEVASKEACLASEVMFSSWDYLFEIGMNSERTLCLLGPVTSSTWKVHVVITNTAQIHLA